jgi:tetratricopeptide (TPR) repeat protein
MNQVKNPPSSLSGARLEMYLDETEQAINQQTEAGVADDIVQSSLLAALTRQTCMADTMNGVYKLHTLWARAGKPEQAMRVLQEQGPGVLLSLSEQERRNAEIALAFWRLQIARTQNDKQAVQTSLAQAEGLLNAVPQAEQDGDHWLHLARNARSAEDYALERRCTDALFAAQVADPQRAAYRAWDQAVAQVRRGKSFVAQGDGRQGHLAAMEAIATLNAATVDQDLDMYDWLRLSTDLLAITPDTVPAVLQGVRAKLPPDISQPVKRGVEVRLARLEAQAAAAQGHIEEALQKARQGHFSLTEDEDDAFSALMMDWMMKVGQKDAAARLAFESVFAQRDESSERACQLAREALAVNEATHPYWALTLACATFEDSLQWVWGDEDPNTFAQRYIDLAEQTSPGHPATAAVQAYFLIEKKAAYAQAMPLLEKANQHAELVDSRSIVDKLWLCRMHVYGPVKALSMPFIECGAGEWCYAIGAILSQNMKQDMPEGAHWDQAAANAMATRYYEKGLTRFESFFNTGQGHFKDANVHTYSMLCNNLAINYRESASTAPYAIELHKRGLAASPFAEHYYGMMWVYQKLEQKENFVAAADRLWHYAQDHGFGRHQPGEYVNDVCTALLDLKRPAEVAIWLQRMDEWWNQVREQADSEDESSYLSGLTSALAVMARNHPEDAVARLEPALPQIQAFGRPGFIRVAGLTMERAGQYARALSLYQQALGLKPQTSGDDIQLGYTKTDMDRCKGVIAESQRPWWKFW